MELLIDRSIGVDSATNLQRIKILKFGVNDLKRFRLWTGFKKHVMMTMVADGDDDYNYNYD